MTAVTQSRALRNDSRVSAKPIPSGLTTTGAGNAIAVNAAVTSGAGAITAAAAGMITQTGGMFGTPGFLAPESLQGFGYSPPGDLFALGCVLYSALAGASPFGGPDLHRVLLDTVLREPRPLTVAAPEGSLGLFRRFFGKR